MLGLRHRKRLEYLQQMQPKRPLRRPRILRVDGGEDVPVLVDQQGQGRAAAGAET